MESTDTPDDEAERPAAELVEDDPRIGITRIGAWAGSAAMQSSQSIHAAVDFCVEVGIRRLDVVCNDHSDRRSPTPFDVRSPQKIIALATAANAKGIDIHLMSWLMPHRDYIAKAADTLLGLADATHAKSIQFDAEEPWVKAHDPMRYDEAAALVRAKFGKFVLGVTAIGFASPEKLGPLARVCEYGVPQCYATSGTTLRPGTIVQRLVRHWTKNGITPKELVIGLAAYNQDGIPGHTKATALQAAFDGAAGLPSVDEVVYWSLRHIRGDQEIAATIKRLAAGTVVQPIA